MHELWFDPSHRISSQIFSLLSNLTPSLLRVSWSAKGKDATPDGFYSNDPTPREAAWIYLRMKQFHFIACFHKAR